MQAVCAGFIYAVGVADGLLQARRMRRALVIGSETMTRILNWEDRTTCVLFGDGAGAVIMERDDSLDALTGAAPRGLIDLQMNADGNLIDILHTTGGPSSTQSVGHLYMAGKEVFRHAVEKMASAVLHLLDTHGFTPDDVKWYVPHQANQRILTAVAARIGAPPERFIST
ncbi:MAG: 3-oxoacyl-[acyl-carrier-protein] synthase III C-terminal domain-containing protein, partial [Pseudomonadota bacterium]|nr:3-oxoacyl-[acyl-carrier-protein] synthase III C-terminal domain-containing protein [Pseudomonadota bacterium]